MTVISAERFTALKAKVKAEMLRRNQSGSVAEYGGAAYDYTNAPAAGRVIQKEHIEKLTGPMRAVNPDLVPAPGNVVTEAELEHARAISDKIWHGKYLSTLSEILEALCDDKNFTE